MEHPVRAHLAAALLVAVGAPSTAVSAPRGNASEVITSPEGDVLRIGADPRARDGRVAAALAEELWATLKSDLELEDLSRARRIDAGSHVESAVVVGDDGISADLAVIEGSGRVKLRKTYGGPAERAREIGHELAAELTHLLTGQRSVSETRILAVKTHGGRRELWVMDVDGRGARSLASDAYVGPHPAWSSDGRTVFYTSSVHRTPELFSVPLAGGPPVVVLAERGRNADARMSPDGRALSVTLTRDGDSEIYAYDLASRGLTSTARADDRAPHPAGLERLTRSWGLDAEAAWSPAGDRLVFVSSRTGHDELWVMDRDGKNAHPLTDLGRTASSPDWSPRGDRVVFALRTGRGPSELWSVDPSSGETAQLTNGSADDRDPRFSPDGRHLVFTSVRGEETDLWIMRADGIGARRISRGQGFSSPAWSPFLDESRDRPARAFLTSR